MGFAEWKMEHLKLFAENHFCVRQGPDVHVGGHVITIWLRVRYQLAQCWARELWAVGGHATSQQRHEYFKAVWAGPPHGLYVVTFVPHILQRKQLSGGNGELDCVVTEGTLPWRDCAGWSWGFQWPRTGCEQKWFELDSRELSSHHPEQAPDSSEPFKVLSFVSLSKQKSETWLGFDSPLWHFRAYDEVASISGCLIFHSVFSSVGKTPLRLGPQSFKHCKGNTTHVQGFIVPSLTMDSQLQRPS